MTKTLTILLLYYSSVTYSQQIGIDSNRINYINIPKTRVYLRPTEGFQLSRKIQGLEKDNNAEVQIFELVGNNYFIGINPISNEFNAKSNGKIIEQFDTIVNSYPAKFFLIIENGNRSSSILVFGDSTFTTFLNGTCPIYDLNTIVNIKKMFLTAKYDKNLSLDLKENIPFTIENNKSKYIHSENHSGGFIYTINQNTNFIDSTYKSSISVIPLSFIDNSASLDTIAKEFINMINKYTMNINNINVTDTKFFNGYKCYEAIIYGDIAGISTTMYFLLLQHKNNRVVIEGITQLDYEDTFKEFKLFSESIKLK